MWRRGGNYYQKSDPLTVRKAFPEGRRSMSLFTRLGPLYANMCSKKTKNLGRGFIGRDPGNTSCQTRTQSKSKTENCTAAVEHKFEAPQLAQVIVSNSLRSAYDDIQIIKDSESKLSDRMIEYLGGRKFPNEYHASELREKYILDDWIACNLIFGRPIRIFLYGNEKHFSAGLKISHASSSSRERLQDYKPWSKKWIQYSWFLQFKKQREQLQ